MKTEEQLKKEGWTRRTVQSEPKLTELVDLYEDIGFKVHLQPFRPEGMEECSICYQRQCDKYKIIYTKPKEGENYGKKD